MLKRKIKYFESVVSGTRKLFLAVLCIAVAMPQVVFAEKTETGEAPGDSNGITPPMNAPDTGNIDKFFISSRRFIFFLIY